MANFIGLDKSVMDFAGKCAIHNQVQSVALFVMQQEQKIHDQIKENNNQKPAAAKNTAGAGNTNKPMSAYERLKASLNSKK